MSWDKTWSDGKDDGESRRLLKAAKDKFYAKRPADAKCSLVVLTCWLYGVLDIEPGL